MEQMRKFRRQHEQLCTVIARVLRPTGRATGEPTVTSPEAAPGDGKGLDTISLEAADLNAIEVRLENIIYSQLFGMQKWRFF